MEQTDINEMLIAARAAKDSGFSHINIAPEHLIALIKENAKLKSDYSSLWLEAMTLKEDNLKLKKRPKHDTGTVQGREQVVIDGLKAQGLVKD